MDLRIAASIESHNSAVTGPALTFLFPEQTKPSSFLTPVHGHFTEPGLVVAVLIRPGPQPRGGVSLLLQQLGAAGGTFASDEAGLA